VPPEPLVLREEPYDGPVAQTLIAQVQQEYVVRYGGPDEAAVDAAEFAPPDGRFVVGYVGTEPVATGGLRRLDADTVEVKRMYVVPAHRGRGHSRTVLARLERLAADLGAERVVLETGLRQPEAVQLYESSGYERIEGFGHYAGHELSVSFAKRVGASSTVR
jgi:GNAT superfamily N-acetyltransferase